MELVQEEDHIPRPGHLGQDVFIRSSNSPRYLVPAITEGRLRDREALLPQGIGDLSLGHPLGQGLHHGGLAHPGSPRRTGLFFPGAGGFG